MKTGQRIFRLSTMLLLLLAFSFSSCGVIRTHGGVEFDNEYRMDGPERPPKPKKEKKHKHKEPKHKKSKHHHD